MYRSTATLCLVLISVIAISQTTPHAAQPKAPQSARQALIEAFFGEAPDHLEKHLPEITRKAFKQLETGGGSPSFLKELSMIGMQAKMGGGNFQTMDTGLVLASMDDPRQHQKFEINVERDDLVGDENQIELSFHMYKGSQEERWPVIPRLIFSLKTEESVWKIYDINLSVRAPIGDPEFLKTLVKNLMEQQQKSNEAMATMYLRAIAGAETKHKASSSNGAYSCSLSKLAEANGQVKEGEYSTTMPVDSELATGKKAGYVFAVTGCDALHFKAAAEPATPAAGRRAFCIDESNTLKFSSDGKATTCISRGEIYSGSADAESATGIGIVEH